MSDELFETGLRIRKEVLGEAYVERSLAQADDFSRDFQRMVTEYCWGAGWGRPALSKRDRSLLNLVMIVPCIIFGLVFPVLFLVPSVHAIIAVSMKREDRKHREIVESIERHGPPPNWRP